MQKLSSLHKFVFCQHFLECLFFF